MFQNLRVGSPLYILYKNEPRLAIGEVVSVGTPMPQFGMNYQNGMLSQPRNTVDVKANINGEEVTLQKLPCDLVIADFGSTGMVVSESKEAILSEIESFRGINAKALNDMPKFQHNVEECDKMSAQLNPHIAKEVEQAKEIESLKADISDMKAMLSKALGALKKKEES